MALEKGTLANTIKGLLSTMQSNTDPDKVESVTEDIANGLADAIELFVKSGEVNFSTGTVVGIAPPGTAGGPIMNGAASKGLIT